MNCTSSEAARTGEQIRTGGRRSGRFGKMNPINEQTRTTLRALPKEMKMKINSKNFRVRPGEKVKLREWPTIVKPFCESKKEYQELLEAHVAELSSLQRLHYASNRYALLLIFQGMDAAGKDGA